jgi:hypothetical protein
MPHGGLRHGQQGGAARGVVHRPVEDRIAMGVGGRSVGLAQVVPVGRVDDEFILQFGIRSRHHAGHVELRHGADVADQGAFGPEIQGDGPEVAGLGPGRELIEVLASLGEELAGLGFAQPALERGALVTLQLETFRVPPVLDHTPAVAGGGRGVDEQHPGGAAAGGLLQLVGPPPVVG